MTPELVTYLEPLLIHQDQWPTCGAPDEALLLANTHKAGLAHHPRLGWFVVQTKGPGPCILWPSADEIVTREVEAARVDVDLQEAMSTRMLAQELYYLPITRKFRWMEI